jgi:hypothetical protein
MSQAEHQPTHRLVPNPKLEPIAYLLGCIFHPNIRLDRKKGLEFAASLSSIIDPRGVELEENFWKFSQPLGADAAGKFQIGIWDQRITIEAFYPTDSLEYFERRYNLILKEFTKTFRPKLLLESDACMRGTYQIDGDARIFLATHIAKLDSKRLHQTLGRPVHSFGIRLFMPPFQVERSSKGKQKKKKIIDKVDWLLNIRAESQLEDPSKLFIEAKAQWSDPVNWNDTAMRVVEGRLAVISDYLKTKFISFLKVGDNHNGS